MGRAIIGDGEGTADEKEEDGQPPYEMAPPFFQPWLRLCPYLTLSLTESQTRCKTEPDSSPPGYLPSRLFASCSAW